MTIDEIQTKRLNIYARLKEHDAARKLIEAELLYIQHLCPHIHCNESWTDPWGFSSGGDCLDCGKPGI